MSWKKKFFQGMAVFLRLNGIFPNAVFFLGRFRKNSIGRLFVLADSGKIPKAAFLSGELSEKFRGQTFFLGSIRKNSAGRLSF